MTFFTNGLLQLRPRWVKSTNDPRRIIRGRGKYQVFHLEHGLVGDVVLQEDLVPLKSEVGLAILLQEVEEGVIAVVERKVHGSQELAQGAQWH